MQLAHFIKLYSMITLRLSLFVLRNTSVLGQNIIRLPVSPSQNLKNLLWSKVLSTRLRGGLVMILHVLREQYHK